MADAPRPARFRVTESRRANRVPDPNAPGRPTLVEMSSDVLLAASRAELFGAVLSADG